MTSLEYFKGDELADSVPIEEFNLGEHINLLEVNQNSADDFAL